MLLAFAALLPFRRAGSPAAQAGCLCYLSSPTGEDYVSRSRPCSSLKDSTLASGEVLGRNSASELTTDANPSPWQNWTQRSHPWLWRVVTRTGVPQRDVG